MGKMAEVHIDSSRPEFVWATTIWHLITSVWTRVYSVPP